MSDLDKDFRWIGRIETAEFVPDVYAWECLHCCAIVTQREHHMFWHRNNRLVVEGE